MLTRDEIQSHFVEYQSHGSVYGGVEPAARDVLLISA
jgi:hypothetical protein